MTSPRWTRCWRCGEWFGPKSISEEHTTSGRQVWLCIECREAETAVELADDPMDLDCAADGIESHWDREREDRDQQQGRSFRDY